MDQATYQKLETVIDRMGRGIAVAVSGGVDSLPLATFVHRHSSVETEMYHAVSPAVPESSTMRVKKLATKEGWMLRCLNAGEFEDQRYLENPVNRCFYCKDNLYRTIVGNTKKQVVSGANIDDLGDFRPGMRAAKRFEVRHPYIEAGLTKESVRELARALGLGGFADLPASPCLSSRVETGIRVNPVVLPRLDKVEKMVSEELSTDTVRCRVRGRGIVIALNDEILSQISDEIKDKLVVTARRLLDEASTTMIAFETYQKGTTFLTKLNVEE